MTPAHAAPSSAPTAHRRRLQRALIASLFANGLLGLALWSGATSTPPLSAAASAALESPALATPTATVATADASAAPDRAAPAVWQQLECDDDVEFAARLRAAGVPERVVRRMIWERLFAVAEATRPDQRDIPYWQRRVQPFSSATQRETEAAFQKMQAECVRVFGGMVFDAPYPGMFTIAAAQRGLSRESAAALQMRFDAIVRRQMAAESALPSGSDRAARMPLYEATARDEEAARRELLSAAEYDALRLREPPELSLLSGRASGLDLSFDEYSAMLGFARTTLAPANHSLVDAIRDPAIAPQLVALLGEDRFADLEQALTGSQKTNRLLDRLGLPLRTGAAIEAVRDDIRSRAAAVRSDPTVSSAARDQQLTALANEARDRLTAALTADGFTAYHDYRGEWLDELPAPAP